MSFADFLIATPQQEIVLEDLENKTSPIGSVFNIPRLEPVRSNFRLDISDLEQHKKEFAWYNPLTWFGEDEAPANNEGSTIEESKKTKTTSNLALLGGIVLGGVVILAMKRG